MADSSPGAGPYCGPAPSPATLASAWNLDPVLIAVLALLAFAYTAGVARLNRARRTIPRREQAAFHAGWIIAAAALISPLCALSVSLFSARVGQHMLLALIAAPLIAAGRPAAVFAGLLHLPARGWAGGGRAPLGAAGAFALLLWFWHAPSPYAASFSGAAVYWSMHLSVFAAALWLWSALLDTAPVRVLPRLGAGLFSTMQMSLLGALITLAPRPIYAPHAFTTATWELTPLQDQQLGGVIMWVPGCAVFLAVSVLVLRATLIRMAWAEDGTIRPEQPAKP